MISPLLLYYISVSDPHVPHIAFNAVEVLGVAVLDHVVADLVARAEALAALRALVVLYALVYSVHKQKTRLENVNTPLYTALIARSLGISKKSVAHS